MRFLTAAIVSSSLGLTKVATVEKMPAAFELAAEYDALVIAEEFVAGRELTAAFLAQLPLPGEEEEEPEDLQVAVAVVDVVVGMEVMMTTMVVVVAVNGIPDI